MREVIKWFQENHVLSMFPLSLVLKINDLKLKKGMFCMILKSVYHFSHSAPISISCKIMTEFPTQCKDNRPRKVESGE